MKRNIFIQLMSGALMLSAGLSFSSCNFLDIVPPEQATMEDATLNPDRTEAFLYSCYTNVKSPITYVPESKNQIGSGASADEFALPQIWGGQTFEFAYDQINPSNGVQCWNFNYKYIGQIHLFLEELPKAQGITDLQREEWTAEAYFLLAYYHFQILRAYGPCPITEQRIPQGTPASEYGGRMHYDAVTNWIVDILDKKVIEGYKLPTSRDTNSRGRATHAAACALKARVLLYAASPLWNGGFPYRDWQNKVTTSYGGVDYGYELVSKEYEPQKWERARVAYEEALREAQIAGHKLYGTDESSMKFYTTKGLPLNKVYVPGNVDDEFKERVLMLRYMMTARQNEGNMEYIWGVSDDNDFTPYNCMMPYKVLQRSNGNWIEGYNSYSPLLNAMERFYTEQGKFLDSAQPEPAVRLERANVDTERPDIINLCVGREPRFYAWMAYDQGDWGTIISAGDPVRLELKDSKKQGYEPGEHFRDHCVTGFLCQKFVRPDRRYEKNGSVNNERCQRPLIRMAELYLSLAECYAVQGNTEKALENLNMVHERAGLKKITEADLSTHSLMEWIQNERFIELYGEGHRFYDVRRWMIAPQVLAAGVREGLNAEVLTDPSFEEFNQRIKVAQPYKWTQRMYIAPILQSEIGKNTNLVQAPGY